MSASASTDYLLPGLVDAHVHLTMDFAGDAPPPGTERVAHNHGRLHAAGIVAARDAGRPPASAPVVAPGVTAAAAFLAPPGGFLPGLYEPVGPEALVATALDQVRAGAPWVKLMADFPGPDGNWFAPRVAYETALVADLVAAVHGAGARVMAHVSGPVVGELVRVGVDSIEHGPMVDAALAEDMADRGTIWTPTVATIVTHVGPLPVWRETVGLAVRLGVPVLAGSDELPAGALWREVVALHEHAGLEPEAALATATDVPRQALGLAPAHADELIVCPADPRDDLRVLARARPREPAAA
jgi:imidazolonepropionase-like amidohydrolase